VHRSGDEAAWWSNARTDATDVARTLWTQTHPPWSVAEAPIPESTAAPATTSVSTSIPRLLKGPQNRKTRSITAPGSQ
jgi:hypothetical protein